MQITEVKVFPVSEEKLKAFVSVVFDGCFMVNDIKIINGRDGLFISMPSRKKKNGEFKDVAHPLNNETRRMIEGLVLDEYERILSERGGSSEHAPALPRNGAGRADEAEESHAPPPPAAEKAASAAAERSASAPRRPEPAAQAPAHRDGALQEGEGAPTDADEEERKRSLKEIEEIHLSDSFWSMS